MCGAVQGGDEKPGKEDPNAVWQDREIRFDVAVPLLELRRGEFQIDSMDSVEDTKVRAEVQVEHIRLTPRV